VTSTILPFSLKYIRLPNQLIHSFCLHGRNFSGIPEEKTYHPKNIIARFSKPRLCYDVEIELCEYSESWELIFNYNCSVHPSLAKNDFLLWLEVVINEYAKT
jgi:hypothetical protein